MVRYGDALRLQERLVADRKAGRVGDIVLSLQHPPTYTLGKRREKAERNLLTPEAELCSLGAELHRTERGGDVTFHGPRQAVLYPILSSRSAPWGSTRGGRSRGSSPHVRDDPGGGAPRRDRAAGFG